MSDHSTDDGARSADGHLTTCQHDANCCVVPTHMIGRVGKRWATALSGLVAGVVIASMVLIPWMFFQKSYCEELSPLRTQPPVEGSLNDDAPESGAELLTEEAEIVIE